MLANLKATLKSSCTLRCLNKLFNCYSKDGQQIFKYNSDVKKLKLVIYVTNMESDGQLAEDAHNTELNITVPSSLQFSAVNPKVTKPEIMFMV